MIYTELVTIVMGISLMLYVLLGGADFGAGIIELFVGDRISKVISRAIAPVWEANHIWLIIAVVILFNGFPKAYALTSTALHIPILIVLLGIIARGSAFTFRHYDAVKDGSEWWYSQIFRWSSVLTVFFSGVTVAAMIGGTIPEQGEGFVSYYIAPWTNIFTVSVGAFLTVVAAYISAIFLLGEVETDGGYVLLKTFVSRLFIAAVVSGLAILVSSFVMNLHVHHSFLSQPISVISGLAATILVPLIFRSIHRRQIWRMRVLVGGQILLIVLGWFGFQWPNLMYFQNGSTATIYEYSAPESTMIVLFASLAIGVLIIFPSLFYLYRIYKR